MRYTRSEQTALEVSRVCFGTWQFSGDWGSNKEKNLVYFGLIAVLALLMATTFVPDPAGQPMVA